MGVSLLAVAKSIYYIHCQKRKEPGNNRTRRKLLSCTPWLESFDVFFLYIFKPAILLKFIIITFFSAVHSEQTVTDHL